MYMGVKTKVEAEHWIRRGVAMLAQLDDWSIGIKLSSFLFIKSSYGQLQIYTSERRRNKRRTDLPVRLVRDKDKSPHHVGQHLEAKRATKDQIIAIDGRSHADSQVPFALTLRRKCYAPSMDYIACTQREGLFWMVFNCQE